APEIRIDKWNDAHSILRLKQPAIAWPKLLLLFILILMWVKSADWVNRDTQIYNLGYGTWNPILFFPFFVILLLFAFPVVGGFANFWLAFGLLFVCYLATYVPYVLTRNKRVELHQKLFTSEWFRYEFAEMAGKVGWKIEHERKAEYEKGAPVDL